VREVLVAIQRVVAGAGLELGEKDTNFLGSLVRHLLRNLSSLNQIVDTVDVNASGVDFAVERLETNDLTIAASGNQHAIVEEELGALLINIVAELDVRLIGLAPAVETHGLHEIGSEFFRFGRELWHLNLLRV
jgi:hypothetical protein